MREHYLLVTSALEQTLLPFSDDLKRNSVEETVHSTPLPPLYRSMARMLVYASPRSSSDSATLLAIAVDKPEAFVPY